MAAPAKSAPLQDENIPDGGAAPEQQLLVSPTDDGEFKAFQSVSRLIEDLVSQLEKDELKMQSDLDWHAMHTANAIACAEAYKSRSAINPFANEQACEPFRLAWQKALREWETAYTTDVCLACSKKQTKQCHLARCDCYVDCRGCGQRVPVRPWRVGIFSCRCEKISTIAGRLFGSGVDSRSNLGLF